MVIEMSCIRAINESYSDCDAANESITIDPVCASKMTALLLLKIFFTLVSGGARKDGILSSNAFVEQRQF